MSGPVLNLTIHNDLAEISRIAPIIDAFCADNGLGDELAHAVNLSLDELLTNTISYGYEDAGRHEIQVDLSVASGGLTVRLRDDARAFDPTEAAEPDLDADIDERAVGGLGIHIVRAMMDDIRYSRIDGHNLLTLIKRAGA
jgi:serine/threonine-protein kinase RsbW/sigma-B regulation protein RsbU (phosphoserine phosphatase)